MIMNQPILNAKHRDAVGIESLLVFGIVLCAQLVLMNSTFKINLKVVTRVAEVQDIQTDSVLDLNLRPPSFCFLVAFRKWATGGVMLLHKRCQCCFSAFRLWSFMPAGCYCG